MTSGHEHERLSAYLDGELAPAERARLAAHLEACAECTARLAELAARKDWRIVAIRAAPSLTSPRRLDRMVVTRR